MLAILSIYLWISNYVPTLELSNNVTDVTHRMDILKKLKLSTAHAGALIICCLVL